MATVKLTASAYTRSSSTYVSVTNPSNMYDDTSDTSNCATIQGRNSSSYTYYCYLHGFNFSAVPSNATITGFTVKVKGYRNSSLRTGSGYRVGLCGSATNSVITGTTCSSDWTTGTSGSVLTIPTGSLTWGEIVNYGSGFSIQFILRRTSSGSTPYLYIYGAEIEVTYTVPTTTYTVSVSSTDQTLTASVNNQGTSQNITAGQPATIFINGSDFTGLHATDNGVDVTSSLVYVSNTNPTYYTYNIAAVNEAHTIVISRVYSVTASTSVSGWQVKVFNGNFEQTTQIDAGDTAYVLIGGGDDYTGIRVTDNGVDVTSSPSLQYDDSGNNPIYLYQINNVQADHTLVVTQVQVTTYTLTATSDVSGVTVSVSESEILSGNPGTVYIDGDITNCILTDNGTDVTSQIQQSQGSETVTRYPASCTTSGTISGGAYQSAIGQSASNGITTNSDYASGGSGSTAYIDYAFDFSSIPADATITTVSVEVCGHCESTGNSNEIARVQLYSGTTVKGTEYNFTSESNVTTFMDAGTWTRAELQDAILRFTIGYYGGAIAGVTWTVEYSRNILYYTISSMTTDHTVTISEAVYTISVSTSETDITVSKSPANGTVQSDDTAYVYITGNLNDIQVIDNNVNVTAALHYTDTEANTLPKVIDQYTLTIPYVHEDHTIVVSHSSAQTTYTVTASTSEQSLSLSTSHDSWNNVVGSGRGCIVYINGSDFTNLYVTDNGMNVTSSLVYVPGDTGNSAYYYYYIGNISANHAVIAYLGAPVTTYSVTASTSVSGWQVTVANSNNQQTSQIEAGDTAYVMISGNDYTGLRVTDNGVDVTSSLATVSGEKQYTITNVQEAHVIVVTQATTYSVTASTSVSGLTLALSSGGNSGNPLTVNEGSTVILTISGSDLTNLSITDNGTDATSSLVSNNGVTTYTISNVQAAHTLVVSQTFTPSTYTVRLVASECTASNSNVTVTNENYLYENTDNTSGYATVQGPNNYVEYYFFLHGFNFSAVPENAIVSSFTVKIKGYKNSNNVSSSNYLRTAPSNSSSSDYISISSSHVMSFNLETSPQTLTLPTYDTTWRQLASYGSDFSIQLGVRNNSPSSTACVYIYGAEIEVTYTLPFTISASSEVTPRVTIQPQSLVVRPGKSAKFILNTNRGIVLKDNGVDVTSQIAQELDPGYSYSVTNLTDPFGFFLNDDDYYESNTQNERNSSACCRFDFHLAATGNISFSVINYSEVTGSDYGVFYKLDTTASTAYNTDITGTKVYWSGKDNNSASVQTVTYTGVSAGDHYIYIKYIKYSSGNQYNDSLQFKVALVTITGSYTPGNIYTYSINPVQANHTLVVEQGIMVYDISATSSSSGLTLGITDTTTSATGNPLTITEGHTARLSISSNDLTDLTIMDNETDVTSSLTTVSGEKQYTITNVRADHTIVIYQSFRITASMNDNYLGIWLGIKQFNTQISDGYRDVDAGTTCYVQLNNNSNNTSLPQTGITATDNGANVTSSLVYNTGSSYDFYSYALTNVQTDHNVVFGYTGTYYTISASTNSNLTMHLGDETGTNISGKCFQGGFFDLYIMPQDSDSSLVRVTDNGVDVTSSLLYQPAYTYGNYTQPAFYGYIVTNVQANHTIVVSLQKIYLKINGSYVQMTNVYKKISNEWVRQTDYTTMFDNNHIYIHR